MSKSNIIYLSILVLFIGFILWGCVPHTISTKVIKTQWESVVEIKEYRQVRVVDSRSNPPKDAYNISRDRDCIPVTAGKTTVIQCHTEYSWTMDRYITVDKIRLRGEDKNPIYSDVVLSHVETGYGNQKLGKQYVNYRVLVEYKSKTKWCNISKSRWENTYTGMEIRVLKNNFYGIICYIK